MAAGGLGEQQTRGSGRGPERAAPSDFFPFDATTAFNNGLAGLCAYWPDASAPPPPPSPLPNVPTLIFSGEQDLRTPTANARAVAAEIPDAQVEVVPFTGHSVIGSDFSHCAADALKAFFARQPGAAMRATVNTFAPTPLTPTKLAYVHPPRGLSGRAGQTLVAALDTLVDFNRQVIGATLQADQELPSGASFGGLRGGFARLTSAHAIMRDFAFVPGVQLTATFPIRDGRLQTDDGPHLRQRGRAGDDPRRLRREGLGHARRQALRPEPRKSQAVERRRRRMAQREQRARDARTRASPRRRAEPLAAAALSRWRTRSRRRARPTCSSTRRTRSTGCRGARRRSPGRARRAGRYSSRSATAHATGAT